MNHCNKILNNYRICVDSILGHIKEAMLVSNICKGFHYSLIEIFCDTSIYKGAINTDYLQNYIGDKLDWKIA